MTLGKRIKACRQQAGMSQEKVAELVGVSRQAVTKWEADQSAPNTENLFRLAEIFGTGVDLLLASGDGPRQSLAEQIYDLLKSEEERKAARRKAQRKRNWTMAAAGSAAYLLLYLLGRIIWCDLSETSFLGWLISVRPSGEDSYLYGWLLSSKLFWIAMAVSVLPTLWGKYKYSLSTFSGFVLGLVLGILFGPYPEGIVTGHTHYGWAIWGVTFLISVLTGIFLERFWKK